WCQPALPLFAGSAADPVCQVVRCCRLPLHSCFSSSCFSGAAMVVHQAASSAAAKPRSAHAKKKARAHAKAEARRQQEADKVEAMPVTNHRAAGIDIGDRSHWVCVGFTKDDVSE